MNIQALALRSHRYPMARGGGLFLMIVGVSLIAGALFGQQRLFISFMVGLVCGMAALVLFARKLGRPFGRPTRTQSLAVWLAIGLQVVLIIGVTKVFREDLTLGHQRNYLLSILLVVGIHFLVFAIAQGPLMLLLGGLCILNAAIGLASLPVALTAFWSIDGLLKLAIGTKMFMTKIPASNT